MSGSICSGLFVGWGCWQQFAHGSAPLWWCGCGWLLLVIVVLWLGLDLKQKGNNCRIWDEVEVLDFSMGGGS